MGKRRRRQNVLFESFSHTSNSAIIRATQVGSNDEQSYKIYLTLTIHKSDDGYDIDLYTIEFGETSDSDYVVRSNEIVSYITDNTNNIITCTYNSSNMSTTATEMWAEDPEKGLYSYPKYSTDNLSTSLSMKKNNGLYEVDKVIEYGFAEGYDPTQCTLLTKVTQTIRYSDGMYTLTENEMYYDEDGNEINNTRTINYENFQSSES